MGFWDYYWRGFYQPSQPRQVKGGIKAQTRQGAFAKSWWAKRWIAVLESFNIGARLGRGKRYAREGQVVAIEIEKGLVTAVVQGSRAEPYRVEIGVRTLSGRDWKRLAEALRRQAIFTARLLAGEMPENIEEAFQSVGLSLFPKRRADLKTDCSCPDWSNPCKHIAAVYYLVGEEFDRDPFLMFKLRGMEREELVALVSGQRSRRGRGAGRAATRSPWVEPAEVHANELESLALAPRTFWGEPGGIEPGGADVLIPAVSAALPRRLGNFPFWRGEEAFLTSLEPIYSQASSVGLKIFLGDSGEE
jgi:uncharacterized Zn finger protein